MLQSSSPSYVLMAGMDECIRMLKERGEEIFAEYTILLDSARKRLQGLRHMKLMRTKRYDPSKLVISVKNTVASDSKKTFNGRELYRNLLDKYHLQAEMAAGYYVVLMTSPADSAEGLERLISALYEIDQKLEEFLPVSDGDSRDISGIQEVPEAQEPVYSSYEAEEKRGEGTERVRWADAEGRVSLEYTYLYPPGIPLIVPGERISAQTVKQIEAYEGMGFDIEGTEQKGQIEVLAHE